MTARSLRVPMTRIPTFRAYRTAITECGSKRAHDRRRGERILGYRLLHKSHKSAICVCESFQESARRGSPSHSRGHTYERPGTSTCAHT